MRKVIISILIVFLLSIAFITPSTFSQNESLTIVTYYPSPMGVYNQLEVTGTNAEMRIKNRANLDFYNSTIPANQKIRFLEEDGTQYASITGSPSTSYLGISSYQGTSGMLDFYGGDEIRIRSGGTITIKDSSNQGIYLDSTGNVGINKINNINYLLEVNGTAGKPGGGPWSNSSDIRLKKNVKN
ncbi:MAG: hypothetical protein ABH858_04165, partial [Candidatus Omnitrophota bacterium]